VACCRGACCSRIFEDRSHDPVRIPCKPASRIHPVALETLQAGAARDLMIPQPIVDSSTRRHGRRDNDFHAKRGQSFRLVIDCFRLTESCVAALARLSPFRSREAQSGLTTQAVRDDCVCGPRSQAYSFKLVILAHCPFTIELFEKLLAWAPG